jgi:hypothetical protein
LGDPQNEFVRGDMRHISEIYALASIGRVAEESTVLCFRNIKPDVIADGNGKEMNCNSATDRWNLRIVRPLKH